MDPVRLSRWRTGIVVALTFVLGAAAGGFATRAVQQRRLRELVTGDPAVMRTRLTMFALEHRLALLPNQRAEAERILVAQEGEYRAAAELCRPRIRDLRRELVRQLAPVLDPNQAGALDELVQEGERFR